MTGIDSLGTVLGVELWRFALDLPAAEVEACWEVLSPDERARADRTRSGPRERYVVGRARLRAVLSGHLGVAPAAVAFLAGPNGKPRLADGPEFNLAHTGGIGLCTFVRALAVARG
jgi:4'-phosphopantetheinyl transferase